MKRSRLFFLALICVLLVTVCLAGCQQNQQEPAETQPTEPPVMEAYYNVEGATYNTNGVSSRPAQADGTYKVKFAYRGRTLTKTIKADAALINQIDSMNILGLVFDEQGVVTGVKTVEEMGGKIIANGYYVEMFANNRMQTNPNKDYSGEKELLKLDAKNSIVTDVTKADAIQRLDTLLKGDQIVAVQDAAGVITDVFYFKGGEIRTGLDKYCPHCKEEVHWKAWLETGVAVNVTGHFFLVEDLEVADQLSIGANVEFILDLNGFTVTGGAGKRVISLHNEGCYMAILDNSEAKTGKVVSATGDNTSAQGGIVWVRHGTFELFSGTLDASGTTIGAHGGAVHVPAGNTFNMYGGTIIGALSKNLTKADGNVTVGGHGGSVYVLGTFNMYDGVIKDGAVEACGTTRGRGGNVAVDGSGTFNMSGGEIYGGKADNGEADLYVASKATFKQTGGTIGKAAE